MTMGPRTNLKCVAFLAIVCIASGQVLETPKGQVEFIGLKLWNAKYLYEKLAEIDPHNPLCMVGLEKLGFAAFSVKKELQGDRMFTLVTVVEPQFSGRIKRRPAPPDELPEVERWSDLLESITHSPNDYMIALQLYDYHLGGKKETVLQELGAFLDPAITKKIWSDLSKLNGNKDKELAAWIIMNDRNIKNRIAAASVLSNFHQSDSTWWALMDAMRYDDMVGNATDGLLTALSRGFPRELDWTPMAVSIKALLDGTNPTHFLTTVRVLIQTRIGPRFAAPLLRNGGSLLIDYLRASREQERAPVRRLLIRLAGKDLGSDPTAWATWISSLCKSERP